MFPCVHQSIGSRRARGAFTLIEVLVVVAIIAVLIAILIPVLSQAKDQARSISCQSNLKQLMTGMSLYVATNKVLPATSGTLFMQVLFNNEWSRPAGVTWDGARDRFINLQYNATYTQPLSADPNFIADVPGKGTLFRYMKSVAVYTCPADNPGPTDDTPTGGGGNGRLSYSLNAYIGYKAPENLQSFRYAGPSLDNWLPGHQKKVSFQTGQRVVFSPATFKAMFEDNPAPFMNNSFPDGSFNCLDPIATRHNVRPGSASGLPMGRSSMAFLDGHAEGKLYPTKTPGRELFAEFGEPQFWRETGSPDSINMAAFIKQLSGPCPWTNN